jgi:hypothetical protein
MRHSSVRCRQNAGWGWDSRCSRRLLLLLLGKLLWPEGQWCSSRVVSCHLKKGWAASWGCCWDSNLLLLLLLLRHPGWEPVCSSGAGRAACCHPDINWAS